MGETTIEKFKMLMLATIIAIVFTFLICMTVEVLFPPDLPEYYVDEIIVANCSGNVIWNGSLQEYSIQYPEESKKLSKHYNLYPFRGWLCGIPVVDIEVDLCKDFANPQTF